jgi:hypothetical protein
MSPFSEVHFDYAYFASAGASTTTPATTPDLSPALAYTSISTPTLKRKRVAATAASSANTPAALAALVLSDKINPTLHSRCKRKFEIDIGILSATLTPHDYAEGFGRLEKYLDLESGLSNEEWKSVLVASAV